MGGTVPDGIALKGVVVCRGYIDERVAWDDAEFCLVFAVPFLTIQAPEPPDQTVGNFLAGCLQASEPLRRPNRDEVRFIGYIVGITSWRRNVRGRVRCMIGE